jgi:cell division septation protein DedD
MIELTHKVNTIDTYRDIVNYNYWWARCQAEPTDACLTAREKQYQAEQAYKDTKLFDSKKLYEEAFDQWRIVLDNYPVLRSNTIMADDLVDEINQYKKVLGKIPGTKFPEKFVLQDMIDLNDGKTPPASTSSKSPEAKGPAESKPEVKPANGKAIESKSPQTKPAETKPTQTAPSKTTPSSTPKSADAAKKSA